MNIQAYIESGVLEQYSLHLLNADEQADVLLNCTLYPAIKQELAAIENAFEKMAHSRAVTPDEQLKQRILNTLGFADEITLNNLPLVDAYADQNSWYNAIEHLIPTEPFEDFFMEVLRHDDKVVQMLVITKLNVPEETHDDRIESFFILKGQCVCTVSDDTYTLNAGDFLQIPVYVEHDITITSPYVVAIVQHSPV
jgi:quercetin dioxygenase-like cupin family protein